MLASASSDMHSTVSIIHTYTNVYNIHIRMCIIHIYIMYMCRCYVYNIHIRMCIIDIYIMRMYT